MRRWELTVGHRFQGWPPHTVQHRRFWTAAGARRHAAMMHILGPDFHFAFTLTHRRTGTSEEL